MGLLFTVLGFMIEKYKSCLMRFYMIVYLAEKCDSRSEDVYIHAGILKHKIREYLSFQSDLLNYVRIME
jgi:hypothetical protein